MNVYRWPAGPCTAEPEGPVFDVHGGRWDRHADGWYLASSGIALRWSSPAMQTAGPFTAQPGHRPHGAQP